MNKNNNQQAVYEILLHMSTVGHSVNGQVACVFGYISVSSILQQQRNDIRVPGRRCLKKDSSTVLSL